MLLACILGGFGFTAIQLVRLSGLRSIDDALGRRVESLVQDLRGGPAGLPAPLRFKEGLPSGPPPGGPPEPDLGGPPGGFPPDLPETAAPAAKLSEGTKSLFESGDSAEFYFSVWSRSGRLLAKSANAPAGLQSPAQAGTAGRAMTRTRAGYREACYVTELGSRVVVGCSLEAYARDVRRFALGMSLAACAILAIGLGGGWVVVGRAIQPIEQIRAAAQRISAGNLGERIAVTDARSELGRMAGVLNSTFERLERAFDEQRQFTADASHELRTPIAVILAEAQSALARSRTEAEYREAIEVCLEAAQGMRRLAESLLALARLDAGKGLTRRVPFDLANVARECVELLGPLAAERQIRLEPELLPAPASGDPQRIKQVLVNLIDNAIHYNVDRGKVSVTTRSERGRAVLVVADTGPGIPSEDLPHIFRRFHRADKVRSRSEHRAGLGLAIVKGIVDAHGGTIDVESTFGAGTTFTVRLPSAA